MPVQVHLRECTRVVSPAGLSKPVTSGVWRATKTKETSEPASADHKGTQAPHTKRPRYDERKKSRQLHTKRSPPRQYGLDHGIPCKDLASTDHRRFTSLETQKRFRSTTFRAPTGCEVFTMVHCDSYKSHMCCFPFQRTRHSVKCEERPPILPAYFLWRCDKPVLLALERGSDDMVMKPLTHSSCLCAVYSYAIRALRLFTSPIMCRRHLS